MILRKREVKMLSDEKLHFIIFRKVTKEEAKSRYQKLFGREPEQVISDEDSNRWFLGLVSERDWVEKRREDD